MQYWNTRSTISYTSYGYVDSQFWGYTFSLMIFQRPLSAAVTRKGAATRARIVDAAAELIFQQGVARTTIEEVRDGAHVSSSQLYHYFEDKPALVRAVIERQADRAIGTQERFDLGTLDGLRDWRDFVVDHDRDTGGLGGCPIGSLGPELAETDPEARAVLAASFKRWEATIMAGFLRCTRLADSRRRPIPPARACHACRA